VGTVLPAINIPLVISSRLESMDLHGPKAVAKVTLTLKNVSQTILFSINQFSDLIVVKPLDTSFALSSLKSSVIYNGQVIGRIDTEVQGLTVGPRATLTTPMTLNMELVVSKFSLEALLVGLDSGLKVDIDSVLGVRVGEQDGGYLNTIDYSQSKVDTFVGK
jgi:hypothetical protein